ncbi:MAG: MFS transporter [Chloroflexi bacterium]|nr:MFS transporter [Chloroflexota bacterium]
MKNIASRKETPEKPRVFYGWWMVLACFFLAIFQAGFFYFGFTAFFNPIISEFGWSRAITSLAFSLHSLEGGLASPVVGILIDRIGPRNLMLTGMGIAGAGFILLSQVQSLWAFYLVFLPISIGFNMSGFLVMASTLAHWFAKKRGTAFSVVSAGYGAGGILIPVVVWLIASYNWRSALVITGLGLLGVGIPVALTMRHKPEQYGYLPDGGPEFEQPEESRPASRESGIPATAALKTGAFWILGYVYLLFSLASTAVVVHIIPFLTAEGFSRERAGLVTAFAPLLSIAGRLTFGRLADIFDKRFVVAAGLALMSMGLLIFANVQNLWQAVLFAIIFGLGYGGLWPIRAAFQGEYFGRKQFGTIQGLLLTIGIVGGISGPVLAGKVFDLQGSYRLAFTIFGLAAATGVPIVLLAKRPNPERQLRK